MSDPALSPELALRYLDELSTDIRAALLLDPETDVAAHTVSDETVAEQMRELALELLDRAADVRGAPVAEVEAATAGGAVFAVRGGRRAERPWTLVVVTGRFALSSLMFYDLRSVLQDLEGSAA